MSVFWWVDDDPKSSVPSPSCWKKRGYQVPKAHNGMEALEQAVNRPAADRHRCDDAKAGRALQR